MVSGHWPTELANLRSVKGSAWAAQLEADIAQLKDALARRQQIGGPQDGGPALRPNHPERAWHCRYASPKTALIMVGDIAHAIIKVHCGGLIPAEVEIPSVIGMHMPDGIRLIGTRVDEQQPTSESSQ
jgi:hypothetical protein